MDKIFGSEGHLKKIIPGYEHRSEQLHMADFILERLCDGGNGLIEAGTGTGKTLAYLVPALTYALENEKKIAVSTETKALQKQLIDKDLPIVKLIFKEYLGKDFSYSLCLGSANYPCRRRFETVVKRGAFARNDFRQVEKLQDLFSEEAIFTRFDVKVSNNIWFEINREPEGCSSFRCLFSRKCPYQMAKKEWAKSDLLVMNHYLFFTNVASGKAHLPVTDVAIFDEAHSIEDIASAQLGFSLSYRELLDILDLFYYKKRRSSLINNISSDTILRKSRKLIIDISTEANDFFEQARDLFRKDEITTRVRKELYFGKDLIDLMKQFMLLMEDVEDDFENEDLMMEFDIARGKLFLFIENLTSFIYLNNPDYVYWMEKSERELLGDIFCKGQPVDVSGILQKDVFSFYESSILVSATLAINGDFSFIIKRLGVDRHIALALDSTFDYKSQMVLYIGKKIAEPSNELFNEQSAIASAEIIKHLKGNCLLLFTSYKMLGEVKAILSDLIDYPIYSQDEYSSPEAVSLYTRDENSVLMGTHSFWQGIDLPGDLLRG
ncbi:MAG: ATP-dependent DNA helicase, partial [bacterium]|nr:ATP-dependent DNA helicase [bacterium]